MAKEEPRGATERLRQLYPLITDDELQRADETIEALGDRPKPASHDRLKTGQSE
jgi:hypothetical protein